MTITLEIRGLARHLDDEDIRELCEEFGDVGELTVLRSESRGTTARVAYEEDWNAELAMTELDGTRMDGRYLQVDIASDDFPSMPVSMLAAGAAPRRRSAR